MKKIICLLTALSFILTAFSACNRVTLPDESEVSSEKEELFPPSEETQEETEETDGVRYIPLAESKKEIVSEEGFYLSASNTFVDKETIKAYPQLTNLPTLYINLDNGASLSSVQHGSYTSATYSFVDDYVLDSYYEKTLQIKGRGNWSWSFEQKPYTLKLDSKANLAGMGEAKKWILVTVHSDKTMMHNYMAQKLAKKMGLYGTCDNEYVDVVCNGKYVGTYVLTEKIQLHENRVNVGDNNGLLFEIEMVYRHSCSNCVVIYENPTDPANSVHMRLIDFGDWDFDSLTTEQAKYLRDYIPKLQEHVNMINKAMQEGNMAILEKTIDMESFVNWYLLNELSRNYDSAFVTSCYCYFNEEGLLCMGPVWDFDTCFGAQFSDYNVAHVATAPWFKWLLSGCPEFKQRCCERWTELRVEKGHIEDFYLVIDSLSLYIRASQILNHTIYTTSAFYSDKTHAEVVEIYKEWLLNRIGWMDSQFLLKDAEDVADFLTDEETARLEEAERSEDAVTDDSNKKETTSKSKREQNMNK